MAHISRYFLVVGLVIWVGTASGCQTTTSSKSYEIDRAAYSDKLHGFWLGQSIGNWTGLVTEMDKIGGEGPSGIFYTRDDWGAPDQPAIWDDGKPSPLSPTIDFVLRNEDEIWGADDDTDIEYIYLQAMLDHRAPILSAEQIRNAWITHIYDERAPTPYGVVDGKNENYLWVSNQRAHDLMLDGMLPPLTSDPKYNSHFDMIDAQLTTESFGLYAPGRPDIALRMAELPIATVARGGAKEASEFYVVMHALATTANIDRPLGPALRSMAEKARLELPEDGYSAAMYDFLSAEYAAGTPWEAVRDSLYEKYQVRQEDGYNVSSRDLYCNGCFAAGINFGASLISLFYGNGDLKETIRIATLAGWDSDNPAATWGGLIGFMIGREGVEKAFDQSFSNRFDIHRTRKGFKGNGIDTFEAMAARGIAVADLVVTELVDGQIEIDRNLWVIPMADSENP